MASTEPDERTRTVIPALPANRPVDVQTFRGTYPQCLSPAPLGSHGRSSAASAAVAATKQIASGGATVAAKKAKPGLGVPFAEMRRLMVVYGPIKSPRRRTLGGLENERESAVRRKFYRWFPDLHERFVREPDGWYRPRFGHEAEVRYREGRRATNRQVLSKKQAHRKTCTHSERDAAEAVKPRNVTPSTSTGRLESEVVANAIGGQREVAYYKRAVAALRRKRHVGMKGMVDSMSTAVPPPPSFASSPAEVPTAVNKVVAVEQHEEEGAANIGRGLVSATGCLPPTPVSPLPGVQPFKMAVTALCRERKRASRFVAGPTSTADVRPHSTVSSLTKIPSVVRKFAAAEQHKRGGAANAERGCVLTAGRPPSAPSSLAQAVPATEKAAAAARRERGEAVKVEWGPMRTADALPPAPVSRLGVATSVTKKAAAAQRDKSGNAAKAECDLIATPNRLLPVPVCSPIKVASAIEKTAAVARREREVVADFNWSTLSISRRPPDPPMPSSTKVLPVGSPFNHNAASTEDEVSPVPDIPLDFASDPRVSSPAAIAADAPDPNFVAEKGIFDAVEERFFGMLARAGPASKSPAAAPLPFWTGISMFFPSFMSRPSLSHSVVSDEMCPEGQLSDYLTDTQDEASSSNEARYSEIELDEVFLESCCEDVMFGGSGYDSDSICDYICDVMSENS